MSAQRDFAIPLFGLGDCGSCLLSWCFPQCMIAQARTKMDGSSCCFNLCAFQNPVTLRWLMRSAYGIEGTAVNDCLIGTFCPCCTVNQAYQTSLQYGIPNPTAGPANNRDVFKTQAGNEGCFTNCLYAFFCPTCSIGSILSNAVDMPFLFGCCCVNPCAARSIMRYHYRIQGDDLCDDCITPTCVGLITYCCPCTLPCTLPYFLNFIMKMLSETQQRSVRESYPKQYLASPNGGANAPPVAIAGAPVFVTVGSPVNPDQK